MDCPKCGKTLHESAKFCVGCGQRIPRCPTCGTYLKKRAKFCIVDGTRIPDEIIALIPEEVQPVAPAAIVTEVPAAETAAPEQLVEETPVQKEEPVAVAPAFVSAEEPVTVEPEQPAPVEQAPVAPAQPEPVVQAPVAPPQPEPVVAPAQPEPVVQAPVAPAQPEPVVQAPVAPAQPEPVVQAPVAPPQPAPVVQPPVVPQRPTPMGQQPYVPQTPAPPQRPAPMGQPPFAPQPPVTPQRPMPMGQPPFVPRPPVTPQRPTPMGQPPFVPQTPVQPQRPTPMGQPPFVPQAPVQPQRPAPMGQPHVAPQPPVTPEPQVKKKKKAIVPIVVVAAVLFLAIILVVGLFVVKPFLENYFAGDTQPGVTDSADATTEPLETNAPIVPENPTEATPGETPQATNPTQATELEKILMPNCVGWQYDAVVRAFEKLPCRVSFVYDYSDTVAKDYILKQNYVEGSELTAATEVVFTVSQGPDLAPEGYNQKVVVTAAPDSSYGTLTLYNWEGGQWVSKFSCNATLGSKGISPDYGEGKKRTPEGVFKLGVALTANSLANSNWPVYLVTSDTCVVDDVNSSMYNTIQSIRSLPSGVSCDPIGRSITRGDFNICIFIEHNGNGYSSENVVAGKGSVITICGKTSATSPTAGCVDISAANMNTLISMLSYEKNPHIEIYTE